MAAISYTNSDGEDVRLYVLPSEAGFDRPRDGERGRVRYTVTGLYTSPKSGQLIRFKSIDRAINHIRNVLRASNVYLVG